MREREVGGVGRESRMGEGGRVGEIEKEIERQRDRKRGKYTVREREREREMKIETQGDRNEEI